MYCKPIFPDRFPSLPCPQPNFFLSAIGWVICGGQWTPAETQASRTRYYWEFSTTDSDTPQRSCTFSLQVYLLVGATPCSSPKKCHHCFLRAKHREWGWGGVGGELMWSGRGNKCVPYLFPPGSSPLTLLKAWQVFWMFVFIKFPCLPNPQILLHAFPSRVLCFA